MINSFVRTTCRHVHQIDYMHFDNKLNCSPKSAANKQKTTATTKRKCNASLLFSCECILWIYTPHAWQCRKKKQLFFSQSLIVSTRLAYTNVSMQHYFNNNFWFIAIFQKKVFFEMNSSERRQQATFTPFNFLLLFVWQVDFTEARIYR